MIRELLLISLFSFNIQDFVFLITSTIDIFAATIIAVSIFQTIIPMVKVTIISTLDVRNRLPSSSSSSAREKLIQHDSYDTKQKGYWIKKNFVRGLLLALELESANAILKMGLFTSIMIEMQQQPSSLQLTTVQDINNFIFFVAILSIRVAINQTLRKYGISR